MRRFLLMIAALFVLFVFSSCTSSIPDISNVSTGVTDNITGSTSESATDNSLLPMVVHVKHVKTVSEGPGETTDFDYINAKQVEIVGDLLYFESKDGKLYILNIEDPTDPKVVLDGYQMIKVQNYLYTYYSDRFRPFTIVGDYIYTQDCLYLKVIDISDPKNPEKVYWEANLRGDGLRGVYVYKHYAYFAVYPYANGGHYLWVFDITNPKDPVAVYNNDDLSAKSPVVYSDYLYLIEGNKITIRYAADPSKLSRDPDDEFEVNSPNYLYVNGGYLYVAKKGGMEIYSLDDPSTPTKVSEYDFAGVANKVFVTNKVAYISFGDNGIEIVDVSNPYNPKRLGHIVTEGYVYDVKVRGKYAYMAAGDAGLMIVDVSDPANPKYVYRFCKVMKEKKDDYRYFYDVALNNDFAYVAAYDHIAVVDVSDATNATVVSDVSPHIAEGMKHIYISGDYAFLGGDSNMEIFDISDPKNVYRVGGFPVSDVRGLYVSDDKIIVSAQGSVSILNVRSNWNSFSAQIYTGVSDPMGVTMDGSYVYIADREKGIVVINASEFDEGEEPKLVSVTNAVDAHDLYICDNYLYLADGVNGLSIYDVTNPSTPIFVGHVDMLGNAVDVVVKDGLAYLALDDNGVSIVDIRDPRNPREVAHYSTPGRALGIAVKDNYVYVADYDGGLVILRVSVTNE